MDFAIAGVAIIPLVLGLVEFAKKLGINGNASLVLSVALGFVFSGIVYAVQSGLLPDAVVPWVNLVIVALSGGLGAAGLYDLGKKWSSG